MNTYFDNSFNKNIVTIYPGEFYSTSGTEMISTVLGSCISIALFDLEKGLGGLNHFMLSKDCSLEEEKGDVLMGKFGEYAIDLLIADLEKKGTSLSRLSAKVFGGSNVFNLPAKTGAQVGDVNIKFAFECLNQKNIPIISSNTGGTLPRKIFFDPATSKVYLKYIQNSRLENANLETKETIYLENLKINAVKNLFPEA